MADRVIQCPASRPPAKLALAIQHPARDQETQDRARKLLARGEAQLPPEVFADAIEHGKAGGFESVLASLQTALAAAAEYSDGAQPTLSPHPDLSIQPLIEPLTPRELEVLRLIAGGLSNPEIAAELVIAVGTVKAMTHNIYGKLGTNNRVRAVSRATELNLL